jgi:hypothetical protein
VLGSVDLTHPVKESKKVFRVLAVSVIRCLVRSFVQIVKIHFGGYGHHVNFASPVVKEPFKKGAFLLIGLPHKPLS